MVGSVSAVGLNRFIFMSNVGKLKLLPCLQLHNNEKHHTIPLETIFHPESRNQPMKLTLCCLGKPVMDQIYRWKVHVEASLCCGHWSTVDAWNSAVDKSTLTGC